jgi:hypothetical protein
MHVGVKAIGKHLLHPWPQVQVISSKVQIQTMQQPQPKSTSTNDTVCAAVKQI